MSSARRTNNFFDAPEPAAPAPSRKPVAQPVEEEPEEESVPEVVDPMASSMHRRSSRPSSGSGSRSNSGMNSPTVNASTQRPAPTASFGFQAPAGGPGAPRGGGLLGGPAPATRGAQDLGRRMGGMSLGSDDHEPDAGSEVVGGSRLGAPGTGRPSPRASPAAAAPMPPLGRPAPPAAAHAPARPGVGRRGPGVGKEMVIEDMDDFEADFGGAAAAGVGPTSRGRAQGAIKTLQGEPIPQQTMRAVQQLLWGSHNQPPPSWKQGFYFCSKPGLHFGLVQAQGGPCGVLAGVQANILAALKPSSGNINLDPSAAEQQTALVSALATVLWQARAGSNVSLALLPSHDTGARMSHEQVARGATFVSASSRNALEDMIRTALPSYMEQGGWGVVLLVVSLALTRGVHVVRGDMDEPTNALMGMHGYCTQELVNLILTGKAVSNVFDGEHQLDGKVFQGVAQPCRLGLLTLFEWYKYVEVGRNLKSPELPIWVVCSESHFTVLFAPDGRALRGTPPFDLIFYDELANQEEVIRLTVRKDPTGGWTAKMGETIGDRGKCEGQNIPPLECVIETRWPGSKVDWNGADPIL